MKALAYSLQIYIPTLVKAEKINNNQAAQVSALVLLGRLPLLWGTWGQPSSVPWDSHCPVSSLELSLQQNEEMFLLPIAPLGTLQGQGAEQPLCPAVGLPHTSCATGMAGWPWHIQFSFFLQVLDYGNSDLERCCGGYFFQFSF